MAKDWGVPPWRLEEEATQEWVDKFVTYQNEAAEARSREQKKRNAKAAQRRRRGGRKG